MRLLKAYALTAIVGTQTAQGKILKISKNFKGSVVRSNSKKINRKFSTRGLKISKIQKNERKNNWNDSLQL